MARMIKITPQVYKAIKEDKTSTGGQLAREYDVSTSIISRIKNSVTYDDYKRSNNTSQKGQSVSPLRMAVEHLEKVTEELAELREDHELLFHRHSLLMDAHEALYKAVKSKKKFGLFKR
jgi:hypothetical protein